MLLKRVFQVAYNFSLPYEKTVQKDGLVYPVHIWKDATTQKMRQDTYGGINSMITTKVRACLSRWLSCSSRLDMNCIVLWPVWPPRTIKCNKDSSNNNSNGNDNNGNNNTNSNNGTYYTLAVWGLGMYIDHSVSYLSSLVNRRCTWTAQPCKSANQLASNTRYVRGHRQHDHHKIKSLSLVMESEGVLIQGTSYNMPDDDTHSRVPLNFKVLNQL